MATIAGANTTTLTETIPTESINGLVLPPANLIRVYQAFTWQCPATGAKMVFPQIVAGSHRKKKAATATARPPVRLRVEGMEERFVMSLNPITWVAATGSLVISGTGGVILAAAAGAVASESGIPRTAVYVLGAFLVGYGVAVYGLSTMAAVRRPGIAVAIANVVFTVAAILAVVDDVWPLTATGVAMMIVSAVYTLAMAELQYQEIGRAHV